MKSKLFFAFGLLAALGITGCFEAKTLGSEATPPEPPPPPPARIALPIAISEICPGNSTLNDEFGEDPGWVEITNLSPDSVRLDSFRLRARSQDGPGWRLPATKLAPGAQTMLFMSGRDIPDNQPATDSLIPESQAAYSWADSMNNPKGASAVRNWHFAAKKFYKNQTDGTIALSFILHLADNSATLGWASANVTMRFDELDVTNTDRIWMRATIPAGQPLLLRLCDDIDCYKEGSYAFTGTGDSMGVYEFPLSNFAVDFSAVNGIQFDPPPNNQGDYKIAVTKVRFFKSARHPHANFQLQRKGGKIFLEDLSGQRSDTTQYPEISANGSWSRDSATGQWAYVKNGTPGKSNPANSTPTILAAPSFATQPGFHTGPFTVKLNGILGYQTRCAQGGSQPTTSSPLADAGIVLDSSATVACALFDAAGNHGPVASGTFLLNESITLPVVSVSVDPGAMFDPDSGLNSLGPNASSEQPNFGANFWRDTELPIHVELFESNQRSFVLPAGMSIYGNWSRANAKKSLSIQFREKYGASRVNWPLFPHHPQYTRFKGFGLRNNGGNFEADYLRDGLMSSLTEGRNIEYQLSRHVVVFLNGKYWGIYELREKLDPDYLDTRFGIDPSHVDLLKNNSEIQAGSSADWNELRTTLQDLGPTDSAGWAAMAKRIDFDNFMDYNAIELFSQNTDWPANNVRYWRQNTPASKWRAMLFDLDAGLGVWWEESNYGGPVTKNPIAFAVDSTAPWDAYPNGAGTNVVLRRILSYQPLRNRFLNRCLVQLATNLAPTASVRALDSINTSIHAEIPRDITRWKHDVEYMDEQTGVIRDFLTRRPALMRGFLQKSLKLSPPSNVTLSAEGGALRIEDLWVGSSYASPHFRGVPIQLEAIGGAGRVFMGWSDGVTTAKRTLVPGADPLALTARFQ